MSDRLYRIKWMEGDDECEAIVPEYCLTDLDDIYESKLIGELMDGFMVVDEDDEDDDPSKKELPEEDSVEEEDVKVIKLRKKA